MIIREANKKDFDQLADLFDQYRIFYLQQSDRQSAKAFLKKRRKRKESVIFVAEEDGAIKGFTQLFPIFSSVSMCRTWLLNDLFVEKGSRKKGVATALLQAAAEFGKKTDSKWLLLQTAEENEPAQKLYEQQGWKKETDYFYRLALTG